MTSNQKEKKIIRLAIIRSDDELRCPFGLSIPQACHSVGDAILKMAPMPDDDQLSEEEKEHIKNNNNEIYLWTATGNRCPFAKEIFDKTVQCEFKLDNKKHPLVGSPFFWKNFSGLALDGLYSYPMGYYVDTSIDRGMYYGPYSIENIGSEEYERTKPDTKKK